MIDRFTSRHRCTGGRPARLFPLLGAVPPPFVPTGRTRHGRPSRRCGTEARGSRSPGHRTRRPVSTAVTIALAGVAALITLWLGMVGHFSATPAATEQMPDQLAVVQVQAGETLQQLAGRVAPDAPAGQVVQRIRDLNKLESASLDAGQTLIAPIG
ncbi:LysM peptidoglycan-binding domain-containing protein [Mycolicibacterium aichiense]|uniref:LysM peptidoglycan-binding domain-containing protein n=1 Tax=Mycolicibacterium aichiense TaxID=1799 RepID=UPI003D66896A